jgi:hypothetical protein
MYRYTAVRFVASKRMGISMTRRGSVMHTTGSCHEVFDTGQSLDFLNHNTKFYYAATGLRFCQCMWGHMQDSLVHAGAK